MNTNSDVCIENRREIDKFGSHIITENHNFSSPISKIQSYYMRHIHLISIAIALTFSAMACGREDDVQIAAYYFDGWSGQVNTASTESWTVNAPTHMTERLYTEFADREPLIGWRDDDVRLMEKQINLAVEKGIDIFAFCWYWRDNKGSINEMAIDSLPINTGIQLFMKARNHKKMKFCLMVANHQGSEIIGLENWEAAMDFWARKYFKDPSYVKIDNQPMVLVFSPVPFGKCGAGERGDVKMKEYGYDGLFAVACGNGINPGFDMKTWYNIFPDREFPSQAVDYDELGKGLEEWWYRQPEDLQVSPVVMSGWDPRPWRSKDDKSTYYINRTPEKFRTQLDRAYDFLEKRNIKHKFIFIDAWNEYGEGSYLFPTKGDPEGEFLNVVKQAKKAHRGEASRKK